MAYSTGTATDVNDLLDKLRVFCSTNGWTIDANTTEGTGKRWHGHIGSLYANFRSFLNETPSANVSNAAAGVNGFAFNVGTGYSVANNWYDQAGVPIGSSSKYMTAGMTRISGAITAYHFFAHNAGANIVAVVEYSSGVYQYIALGSLTQYGTFTGGSYFFGSTTGVTNTAFGSGFNMPRVGFFGGDASIGGTSGSFINATVDAEAGWKWSITGPGNAPTGVRKIFDNYARWVNTIPITPNTLNSLVPFMPVFAFCYRDTTNSDTTSTRSPIGELPKLYFCRISQFNPAQQVVLGSTNYRVFPFYKKDNTVSGPTSVGTGSSSYYGFAVEE